jgi:hypothetical protein
MTCEYCGKTDKSRLMTRSTVIESRVETKIMCVECWWSKEINVDEENGKLLSKQEPLRGIGEGKPI